MKVLVIATAYPSERYPTASCFGFDQAKALAASGCQVIEACVNIRSIRNKRKLGWEHLEKDGVEIYAYNFPVGKAPFPVQCFFRKRVFRKILKRVLKEHGKPDVAHAHFGVVGAGAWKACKEHGIPLFVTEHGSFFNVDQWTAKIKERSLQGHGTADRLITVSKALGDKIKKNTGYESVCVHNIVDTGIFNVSEKKNSGLRFVSVGSLLQGKGFDLLIPAFARFHKENPTATLEIIGGGKKREELEAMVAQMQLQNAVTFQGLIPRQKIAERFKESDFFVLASRGETFGVAYIEAMAAGLPVIATACGGPEEFVTPETGLLIPVEDENAIYEAMKTMAAHKDQYDPHLISAYAKDRFSPEAIAGELIELYQEIIS